MHGLLCWMVRIPKYFGTCLCTSSQRNSPSLCCKVVVYSVNYSFCLKQISLNQFWNRISIIWISYSCTSMWLQKEFTLLHGQFLTVRCEHYQICVKKSWSEFNQILCRHSIAPKLAKCLQFEVYQQWGLLCSKSDTVWQNNVTKRKIVVDGAGPEMNFMINKSL